MPLGRAIGAFDLAKTEFQLAPSLLNAAGSLGFSPDPHSLVEWKAFGAFVTNPISMRPRRPAENPALIEFPGGFLMHTGLPNPGFRRALRQFARAWRQSPLPIVVHLIADRPDETRSMVRALEGMENILAVELGFAPLLADDLILLAAEMSTGELPLIIRLPEAQLLRLGRTLVERGAVALAACAPRGAVFRSGRHVSGRLFGPALYPVSLELVRTATKSGLPMIGSGGVFSAADIEGMFAAGALAVEVDVGLWLPSRNQQSPVS